MKKNMIISVNLACLTAGIGLAGCTGGNPIVLPMTDVTTTVGYGTTTAGTTTAIEETTTVDTAETTSASTTTESEQQISSGYLVAHESNEELFLDIIDPYTGEWSNYKTFPLGHISSSRNYGTDKTSFPIMYISEVLFGRGSGLPFSLNSFSSDLSKLYFCKDINGERHVGWLDESGDFTDVTELVTTSSSDFSALTTHSNCGFSLDGYFYFGDETNNENILKRVPLNNISSSSVEEVDSFENYLSRANINYDEPFYNMDGTISLGHAEYYDSSMEYGCSHFSSEFDWISNNEIVLIEDDSRNMSTHSKYTTLEKLKLREGDDGELLAPKIEGRINSYPKVSPDKKTVAFLSQMVIGDDNNIYLFTVSTDGGDPQKVTTDYYFGNDYIVLDWI